MNSDTRIRLEQLNTVLSHCRDNLDRGNWLDVESICERFKHLNPELRTYLYSLIFLEESPKRVLIRNGSSTEKLPCEATDLSGVSLQQRGAASKIRRFSRRWYKSANHRLGWHLIAVCLGAIMALPVAQIILWWLPFGWRTDPLDVGPVAAQYVEWLVPDEFREV